MSSLKTETKLNNRSSLNTTINSDVFEAFKSSCKQTGIPMNVILEAFMRDYVDGKYSIGLSRVN